MITKKNKYYRTRAALASIRFSLNDRYDRRFGGDGYRIGLFVGWPLFWMGLIVT